MKLYVTDRMVKNQDGDLLQVVKVGESKPKKVSYLVFIGK